VIAFSEAQAGIACLGCGLFKMGMFKSKGKVFIKKNKFPFPSINIKT
jgi:hypothetical protein